MQRAFPKMTIQTPGNHMMGSLYKTTYQSAALAFTLYVLLFLFVDRPVSMWLHACCADNQVHQAGVFFSTLAYGAYVSLALALAVVAVLAADPGRERPWTGPVLYVCLSLAIAWCVGDGLKYLLGRYRPVMLFEDNLYGFHFFSTQWRMNSTPSGHTLRAFAVCTSLSVLFRRYAGYFIALATLIGLSRIVVTDHYASDIVFGAFIGTFSALWTAALFFRDEGQEHSGTRGKDR